MKTNILALLVIFTFAFFSCSKQDGLNQPTNLSDSQLKSATIAVNDVAIEGVTQEANFETDFYAGYENLLRQLAHIKGGKGMMMEGHNGMHYIAGHSPVVSIDTAASGYPIVITVAYGNNTITKNGREIGGTVKIEISGKSAIDGNTRKISYIGCSIDSMKIEGNSTQTFSSNTRITHKMTTTSDVTFTLANGTVINRVEDSAREWLKGFDTPKEGDAAMIQITGSIQVKSSTGDTYERLITEPLIRLEDCHYPVQGVVQYSKNGSIIGELNYGDGKCDNLAELTTGGETIPIELQGKMPKANMKNHHKANKGGMGQNGGMMGGN